MDKRIPAGVVGVLDTLAGAGYEGWCVGGCVRDLTLERVPEDWDVTTSAHPEAVLALFAPRSFPTGLRHGTVTVETDTGKVEVTTYRLDGNYADHRHPDSVSFSDTLEEDLRRRDFTVNAMAMGADGTLCDPFGGGEDLRRAILRCVGDPEERFREDALRILRCLRFSSVLGFAIAPETAAALRRSRELLKAVAAERICAEFLKLLSGAGAAQVLRAYPEVIGVFLPELSAMVGFDQRNRHHCYDVWEHTLHALDAAPRDPLLRLAVLLHDAGKPSTFTVDAVGCGHFYGHPKVSSEIAKTVTGRLRLDNAARDEVVTLVAAHDRVFPRTEKGVRRALREFGEERLRRLIAVKRADNMGQSEEFRSVQVELDRFESLMEEALRQDACFSLKQLAVNGRDLLALGFSGPAVGRTLDDLLTAVVEGRVPNDREALLDAAKKVK